MTVNREELAWAAGFFDGEGCSSIHNTPKNRMALRLNVGQVNRDNLHRFQAAVGGLGAVGKPCVSKTRVRQPFSMWETQRFEHSQAVIALLWPWLGQEKRLQASTALKRWQARMGDLPLRSTKFNHARIHAGHDVYVNGHGNRRCRTCIKAQQLRYKTRMKQEAA